ncbi:MAG: hypothetical protein QOH85_690, partial [Acidobacteriaceae bacterium]|nr:hypothetical protein [Acidobacteriaceae bacterium]
MQETVEQWMRRTYKPGRFRNEPGFHADREQRLIADRENDAREQGYPHQFFEVCARSVRNLREQQKSIEIFRHIAIILVEFRVSLRLPPEPILHYRNRRRVRASRHDIKSVMTRLGYPR